MVVIQKPQIIEPGKVPVEAFSVAFFLSHMVPNLKKVMISCSLSKNLWPHLASRVNVCLKVDIATINYCLNK